MEKYGVTRQPGDHARDDEAALRRAVEREKARLAREQAAAAGKHQIAKERRDA